MKLYAVEVHDRETGDFIECLGKFESNIKAENSVRQVESQDDFDEEKDVIGVYEIEEWN